MAARVNLIRALVACLVVAEYVQQTWPSVTCFVSLSASSLVQNEKQSNGTQIVPRPRPINFGLMQVMMSAPLIDSCGHWTRNLQRCKLCWMPLALGLPCPGLAMAPTPRPRGLVPPSGCRSSRIPIPRVASRATSSRSHSKHQIQRRGGGKAEMWHRLFSSSLRHSQTQAPWGISRGTHV